MKQFLNSLFRIKIPITEDELIKLDFKKLDTLNDNKLDIAGDFHNAIMYEHTLCFIYHVKDDTDFQNGFYYIIDCTFDGIVNQYTAKRVNYIHQIKYLHRVLYN